MPSSTDGFRLARIDLNAFGSVLSQPDYRVILPRSVALTVRFKVRPLPTSLLDRFRNRANQHQIAFALVNRLQIEPSNKYNSPSEL